MAKEIYNKNAREKALLEEAYMNVYSETIENIHSPAMDKKKEYEYDHETWMLDMRAYRSTGPFHPSGPVYEDDVRDPTTGQLIGRKGQPKKPNPADYGLSEDQEATGGESPAPVATGGEVRFGLAKARAGEKNPQGVPWDLPKAYSYDYGSWYDDFTTDRMYTTGDPGPAPDPAEYGLSEVEAKQIEDEKKRTGGI